MTYTFALLAVSHRTHGEIHQKLVAAGYSDQIEEKTATLDMHGIALVLDREKSFAFEKVLAPQPGQAILRAGRTVITEVVAYWPDFRAWEVHIRNDRGHIADAHANLLTMMIRPEGFSQWAEMPSR